MKACNRCDRHAPEAAFNKNKATSDGLQPTCRECCRDWYLLREYGITAQQYADKLSAQGGCCAICRRSQCVTKKAFAVDHCHKTGKLRGLLCSRCNQALGYLDDDKERLARAIEYLGGEW